MGAGYEYLFNFDRYVRKHRVRDRVPITWVTPEPALGHFGIGGIRGGELMLKAFLKWQGAEKTRVLDGKTLVVAGRGDVSQ